MFDNHADVIADFVVDIVTTTRYPDQTCVENKVNQL